MKRVFAIYIFLTLFCAHRSLAQTESCMNVIQELTNNPEKYRGEELPAFILSNKDKFDMSNELDLYMYNLYLGISYHSMGKYDQALPSLQIVTNFIDQYEEEMDLAKNTGNIHLFYKEAICMLHTHADKTIMLKRYHRAKELYEKYNQTETAEYKGVLEDIESINSGAIDNLSLVQNAYQFYVSGNCREAIPLLEKVINTWPKSRPEEEVFVYYKLLGTCYLEIGMLSDAESIYSQALTMLEKQNNQSKVVYRQLCDALGVLYSQVHNYQKAKDYCGLSKQWHEKCNDFSHSYVRCLTNCALAESGLGHDKLAKLLIDVALKYMRKDYAVIDTKDVVGKISSVSSITDNKIDSKSLQDQTDRKLRFQPYITVLSNASMIYQSSGFIGDAIVCMKECIAFREEIGEENALAYNNLACLYLGQDRIDEAIPYFKRALELSSGDYEKNEILFNYALALWGQESKNCVDAAQNASLQLIQSINESFSFLSQEERTNFYKHFELYLPVLNLMMYEYGEDSNYGYIYDNILTAKSLLLRTSNRIKDAILSSNNEKITADFNRMMMLRQQLSIEKDAAQQKMMRQEIDRLDKSLTREAAGHEAFKNSNNIRWQNVQSSLADCDIAIEFYNIPKSEHKGFVSSTAPPRLCAVILKKGYKSPHIVPLDNLDRIKDVEQSELYETDLLYHLVWKPLERELDGVKNIFFAPDQDLYKVGIEYALMPNGNHIDDIYNIYRVSSTRVLAENKNQQNNHSAVLFGGLRYSIEADDLIEESRQSEHHTRKANRSSGIEELRYGVKYLAGTKDEVESIAKQIKNVKGMECQTLSGVAGTEEAFRSLENKTINIIHLATHGFYWTEEEAEQRSMATFISKSSYNDQNYEDQALIRSGLLFSGANVSLSGTELPDDVEDGVLTALELSEMNLGQIDLVVLSACQTALGEISGEGVFGLQRGFKLAGANSLLMSLWKVDDEATKILMVEFYKNLLEGKNKREALHIAQQTLRNTHPEPEYWAGFILLDALN